MYSLTISYHHLRRIAHLSDLDEFKAEWEATKAEIADEMEDAIEAEAEEAATQAEEADAEESEDSSD